jgi:regulator of sigma E protease
VLGQSAGGTIYQTIVEPEASDDTHILGIRQIRRTKQYDFGPAVVAGLEDTWTNTRVIANSLKRVFTGQENFRENVGGPIMIARVTKEAADAGPPFFWNIVAMLSITLAIINILPIPALDGGHLVFLIYEGIVRKEPSLKVRMVMQQIGMVVLLAFMVFVIFNDILKL